MEVHLPAPQARRFVDSLACLPDASWNIVSVKPRALRGGKPLREETRPYPVPGLEVEEDLWEFAHVTGSLVLRVLLAATLVAHGMIEANLPVMIAGLLFLPYHHALLAIALGILRRHWTLAAQGAVVFGLTTVLIAVGGAAAALALGGEPGWTPEGSRASAFVIGAVVGLAVGLASSDDAGRRELIGLAATAHLSVLPIWGGFALVLGHGTAGEASAHAVEFGLAIAGVLGAAMLALLWAGAVTGADRPKGRR